MQPPTTPADTNTLSLDEFVARLAANDAVDGVLLMGSSAGAEMAAYSDIDVLLVLDELPVPARIITTWVENRLTEVHCTTTAVIERVIADIGHLRDDTEAGGIVGWLPNSRIAHDRNGRLARLRAAARSAPPPTLKTDREIYDAWWNVSYTIAHNRRYLSSNDPVALLALDTRMLFSLDNLKGEYFHVRGLPWRGFKEAIKYLQAHDPAWLDLFLRCLHEPDRARKLTLYEELAALTFAPVGPFWGPGETAVNLGPPFGALQDAEPPGSPREALAFWRSLTGAPGNGSGNPSP